MKGACAVAACFAVLLGAPRLEAVPASASPATLARSARALALGGADLAAGEDAAATFGNPASAVRLRGGGLAFTHRALASDLSLESGALSLRPMRDRNLALGIVAHVLRRDGHASDEALAGTTGDPGAYGYTAGLQAAFEASPELQLAAGFGRVATLGRDPGRASGWTTSAGALWSAGGTTVGVALRDAGLGLRDASGAVPATFSYGAAVQRSFLEERLALALQVDAERDAGTQGGAGLECWAARSLAVRAGVRHTITAVTPFAPTTTYSAGAGLRHDRIQVDYAWRGASGTRSEHLLGLSFAFGAGTDLRSEDARRGAIPSAAPAPRAEVPSEVSAPPLQDETSRGRAAAVRQDTVLREDAAPALPRARPLPPPATRPDPLADMPAAAASAASTLPAPASGAPLRFVVRAGVHDDLDSAAQEVARLYRGQLRPTLERSGSMYVVVVQRCATRAGALDWQKRARDLGVRCSIDEE